MSYRNPQIIVDRSAMIWAKGLEKMGNTFVEYIKAKKLAEKKSKEESDLIDRTVMSAQTENRKKITKQALEKYPDDPNMQQQYVNMMTPIGNEAVAYQTRIAMDKSLSYEERKTLQDEVNKYTDFQATSMNDIGYLATMAEPFSGDTINSETLIRDYAIQGEGKDELFNMWSGMKLGGAGLPKGVNAKHETYKSLNENTGKYETMLNMDFSLDPNEPYVKDLIQKGLIPDRTTGLVHKMNLTQLRENGGSFGKKIIEEEDRVKALETAGYVKNGVSTGKGLDKNPVIKTEIRGNKVLNTEEYHFDYGTLLGDPTYGTELQGQISGISTLPASEQKDFLSNRFKWGSLIKYEDYEGATEDARKSFLELNMSMRDMASMGLQQREATEDDVKLYEERGYPPIQVGQPIFFDAKVKVSDVKVEEEQEGGKKLTPAQEAAVKRIKDRAKNRVDAVQKRTGEAVRSVIGNDGFTETKNEKGEVIITLYPGSEDEDVFNMNRSSQVARLAKVLEKGEYGEDKSTDDVIFEIDSYIEELKSKNNPLLQK